MSWHLTNHGASPVATPHQTRHFTSHETLPVTTPRPSRNLTSHETLPVTTPHLTSHDTLPVATPYQSIRLTSHYTLPVATPYQSRLLTSRYTLPVKTPYQSRHLKYHNGSHVIRTFTFISDFPNSWLLRGIYFINYISRHKYISNTTVLTRHTHQINADSMDFRWPWSLDLRVFISWISTWHLDDSNYHLTS